MNLRFFHKAFVSEESSKIDGNIFQLYFMKCNKKNLFSLCHIILFIIQMYFCCTHFMFGGKIFNKLVKYTF